MPSGRRYLTHSRHDFEMEIADLALLGVVSCKKGSH